MNKRITAAILSVLLTASALFSCEGQTEEIKTKHHTFFEPYFDTFSTVYDYTGSSDADFDALCEEIEGELSRYHRLFDIYNEYEGIITLATLNKTAGEGARRVDPEICELLSFAKGSASGKRIITLFGCGGERARDKRPLMAREAEKYSDLLVITEDNSRHEDPDIILADIISGLRDNKDIKIIPDRESAIKEAILTASVGDTVLIVGKGNEAYNDKGGRKRAFDERAIIRDALLLRKNDS